MALFGQVRVAVVCVLWLCWGAGTMVLTRKSDTKAVKRLVAIGDIHADIGVARRAFQLAGGIDDHDNWIGRDLVIVQLGDLIGRSYEERAVLDFIFDVRQKAAAGGGAVHVLIGNHEVFGPRLELRWVDPRVFASYDGISGLELQHPRLAHLPAATRARSAALMPGGVYAKRLAELPAVLKLGETVFAHGGVTPHWATYGIDRINAEVSEWFAGRAEEPSPTLGVDDGSLDDGVMWSRHFAVGGGETGCAMLKESLSILGAKRMIVAHTVLRSIASRCDEQVWAIDVGMSRFYGGSVQVLEILDDRVVSVISASPATGS